VVIKERHLSAERALENNLPASQLIGNHSGAAQTINAVKRKIRGTDSSLRQKVFWVNQIIGVGRFFH
jgi:hypothetical protein|tara:strand:- start:263 stop:463 length:201 start_codon:yes stop_codon:yes gene_type:complete